MFDAYIRKFVPVAALVLCGASPASLIGAQNSYKMPKKAFHLGNVS